MGIKLTSGSKNTSKKNYSKDSDLVFEKEAFLQYFQKDLKPRTIKEINNNRSTAYNISL